MRLIDADALGVGRCSRNLLPADYCAGWNGMVRLLEKAPTVDAVEVVRCRDCKHYKPDEYECGCDFAGGRKKQWLCDQEGYCGRSAERLQTN